MSIHTPLDSSLKTMQFQSRAEKRRYEKEQEKKGKVLSVTREQLESYKADCRAKFMQDEMKLLEDLIFSSIVISLHDKEGFGKTRIDRVLASAINHLECVQQGYISREDLKKIAGEYNQKSRSILG